MGFHYSTHAVVCVSVGATPKSGAAFGQGIELTLLDGVRCRGLESRLFDCPHDGFENSNCDHSKDAGVICQEGLYV